jgi:hypothetical protein
MSWTTVGRPDCSPAWAPLSSVTTTVDSGVDFQVRIRASYPHVICDDRPVVMRAVHPEGQP